MCVVPPHRNLGQAKAPTGMGALSAHAQLTRTCLVQAKATLNCLLPMSPCAAALATSNPAARWVSWRCNCWAEAWVVCALQSGRPLRGRRRWWRRCWLRALRWQASGRIGGPTRLLRMGTRMHQHTGFCLGSGVGSNHQCSTEGSTQKAALMQGGLTVRGRHAVVGTRCRCWAGPLCSALKGAAAQPFLCTAHPLPCRSVCGTRVASRMGSGRSNGW